MTVASRRRAAALGSDNFMVLEGGGCTRRTRRPTSTRSCFAAVRRPPLAPEGSSSASRLRGSPETPRPATAWLQDQADARAIPLKQREVEAAAEDATDRRRTPAEVAAALQRALMTMPGGSLPQACPSPGTAAARRCSPALPRGTVRGSGRFRGPAPGAAESSTGWRRGWPKRRVRSAGAAACPRASRPAAQCRMPAQERCAPCAP